MKPPIKLIWPDGREEAIPRPVHQAFAAMLRGGASSGQQKAALTYLFHITEPMGIASATATERAVGMADGQRWVGQQLAKLCGGEEPWELRHLEEESDEVRPRS